MGCVIAPLRVDDRVTWERLARGYHEFYREDPAPDAYERTWANLVGDSGLFGVGAYVDELLVGIAHYLFHDHVWQGTVCYLQDLFVDEQMRGLGIGRALIEGVARTAAERGAFRLYWTTADTNARARLLYDKVGMLTGYIRYDRAL